MQSNNNVDITPRRAAERYLGHRREEVSEDTVRGDSTPVKRFAQWVDQKNGKTLQNLNDLDLQDFYDSLKADDNLQSKTTYRNYMNSVRLFLLFLERMDAAPDGIAEKVHIPSLSKEDRRRDEEIDPDRVKQIIDWLDKYRYASRNHVIMLILWRCGLRRGSLYSLDIDHFTHLEDAGPVLTLHHQPETGTPLKNGGDGERPINLTEKTAEVIEDYIDHNRTETTDEYGRKPLLTSRNGRYSVDQFRKTVLYYTCPTVTGIDSCSCEEQPAREYAYECEKSRSPHVIRAASITYWRQNDAPVEVVSGRMDVSRDIIEDHYDRRTKEGKAKQRRKFVDQI